MTPPVAFACGAALGLVVGVLVMACMCAAKRGDENAK
jgi:hypothetical protein